MSVKRTSVIWSIPLDQLEKIVKESESYTEILKTFGLCHKGGNNKTLKRRLDVEGVDYTHLKVGHRKRGWEKGLKSRQRTNEEIFKKDSEVSQSLLRNRVIRDKILKDECYNPKCSLKGEWLGEKLTLQIDHINGIRNDNRIENLRYLCPNCHSQTPTYNGSTSQKEKERVKRELKVRNFLDRKQKGLTFKCKKCSEPLYEKTQKDFCSRKCAGSFTQNSTKKPPKEILEEEIKTMTFTALGKKYGVSDNSVRKWCKNYGLSTKSNYKPKFPEREVVHYNFNCYSCGAPHNHSQGNINYKIKENSKGPFCSFDCYIQYQRDKKEGLCEEAPLVEELIKKRSKYFTGITKVIV